jgi:hypothetical protein
MGGGPMSFAGLTPGHYSFHVRSYNAQGILSAVESNNTILSR